MAKESKRQTFEELQINLDRQVARLEQGGLTLEEAIQVYEDGMRLARECQARLDEADLKITKLRESFAVGKPAANVANTMDAVDDYEYVSEESDADDGSM